MTLPVEQLLQFMLQAGKELSFPATAAIVGVLLARWLSPASEATFGAAGFLVGTLATQIRNWARSRELPYQAYLCISDSKLDHTIIFERHKEQSMFRQAQYCQICGKSLVRQCPKCGKAIMLRARDEAVGRFCRNCGDRLFDEVSENTAVSSKSDLKRRQKRPGQ